MMWKKMMYLNRAAILGAALLSGCASTASQFSCPAPKTGMCQSVNNVDKMVDTGQISINNSGHPQRVSGNNSVITWGHLPRTYLPIIPAGKPLRKQDVVMAVWISPYEDSKGYYHDESTVYAVMIPSQWSIQPVKAVESAI